MTDCQITGNNAFFGAGVYDKSTIRLTGCTISGNTDGNTGGNTVQRGAGVFEKGTGIISDCLISDNSTVANGGGGGGGLYNDKQLTVEISTITGNSAGNGGGLYNKAGTASLVDCTISGNSGTIEGGNLDNQSGATSPWAIARSIPVSPRLAAVSTAMGKRHSRTARSATMTNGSAGRRARGRHRQRNLSARGTRRADAARQCSGGQYRQARRRRTFQRGHATLTDSTIAGNYGNNGGSLLASDGGGVANEGTVTLVASTISGNKTTDTGGGIYDGPLGTDVVNLDDTIVAGNTLGSGAASDIAVSMGLKA